jgi:hypothetical protein
MSGTISEVLSTAVSRILRALIRALLRHGVSYHAFADLAKWIYVDMAMDTDEFGVAGRKQSISRAAVLTGLSRKEVVRVSRLPRPADHANAKKPNRAARVITAWLREPDFLDGDEPAVLPIEGNGATFSELVRRYSGDVTAGAVLYELTRVGAVERLQDGRVRLVTHAYIPQISDPDMLRIFGTDVSDLVSTIDHNLNPDTSQQPWFQRKVVFDNLPDNVLPEFRDLSAKQAQSLLEMWAHWLARHDRDVNPSVEGTGRNRAGIGIYYFEELSEKGI